MYDRMIVVSHACKRIVTTESDYPLKQLFLRSRNWVFSMGGKGKVKCDTVFVHHKEALPVCDRGLL